jgi:hypothetical protein
MRSRGQLALMPPLENSDRQDPVEIAIPYQRNLPPFPPQHLSQTMDSFLSRHRYDEYSDGLLP